MPVPLVEVVRSGVLESVHLGLRLQALHERNQSNEALYDYNNNRIGLALTSWF